MRNYFSEGFSGIKKAMFDDRLNLMFFSTFIFLYVVNYLIWIFYLNDLSFLVLSINGIFPVKYLTIVIIINTLMAVFSYEKEREISYLLLGANILLSVFIFILEIFYLMNLQNYV